MAVDSGRVSAGAPATFILFRKTGRMMETLLEAQIKYERAFEDAVKVLAERYNATIIKQEK